MQNLADSLKPEEEKLLKKSVKLKRIGIIIIRILISAALIFWILKDTNFKEILSSIESANFLLVITSFSLHFIGYYVSAVRWKLLLSTQGVETKIGYLIKSYLVSTFFNNLLPSTVGGDAIRAYDSYKE